MADLDGRVAVVTGAARGIGLGIAERLSAAGRWIRNPAGPAVRRLEEEVLAWTSTEEEDWMDTIPSCTGGLISTVSSLRLRAISAAQSFWSRCETRSGAQSEKLTGLRDQPAHSAAPSCESSLQGDCGAGLWGFRPRRSSPRQTKWKLPPRITLEVNDRA